MSSKPNNDPENWLGSDLYRASSSLNDDFFNRRLIHRDSTLHGRRRKQGKTSAVVRATPSHRVALFEIPLRLDETGLSLERKTNMTVYSSFPVSGPWRGALGVSTHMRGRTGYSTGKGDMFYSFGSVGSIRGGVVLGERSNLVLGGTLNAPAAKTSLTATIQARRRGVSKLGISSKHELAPHWTLCTSCALDPSRKTDFRINLLSSKTLHRWNVGLGWRQKRPSFSLQVTPKLWSPQRLLQLSVNWSGGTKLAGWTVGGTLTQQTSASKQATKFSVGLSHSTLIQKGLVWTFSWTLGELTLRIPIALSSIVSSSSLWYPVQVLYFSFMTRIIQDIVADVLRLDKQASEQQLAEQQQQLNREKARQDAAQQQLFMEKQAKNRTAEEEQRNGGLVIRKAVYHVDGGDYWDVTIPLQFWVIDSVLELPASSKRHMLGFYNVAASVSSKKDMPVSTTAGPKLFRSDWWTGFWLPQSSTNGNESNGNTSAKLSVQYDVSGRSYELTIQDHEELVLPSLRAVLIK